jgi:PBP1b-binding outer membrane lipoprotein LpoB
MKKIFLWCAIVATAFLFSGCSSYSDGYDDGYYDGARSHSDEMISITIATTSTK